MFGRKKLKAIEEELNRLREANVAILDRCLDLQQDETYLSNIQSNLSSLETNLQRMKDLIFSGTYTPPQELIDRYFEMRRSLETIKTAINPDRQSA